MNEELKKAAEEAYRKAQILQKPETKATEEELKPLSNNWKNEETPTLQRQVVDVELQNLRIGFPGSVYLSLIKLLKEIPLKTFSLLDAACATGYYSEVIRTLDSRSIEYHGSDYSESMIRAAQLYYPGIPFEVQDLTALKYPNGSFDVVMASGVLEHIPAWTKAVSEMCRVARHYVVHHRCPLTPGDSHEHTIGTQYNIETPRIFFAKAGLIAEYEKHGFRLIKEVDVYDSPTWEQKARSFVKSLLGRKEPKTRTTKSFLLKRQS